MIKAVGQLLKNLSALLELFKEDEPALRPIRCAAIVEVVYIFGDASGSGFGSSCTEGIYFGYRFGVWNEEGDGTSSNYRECCDLVYTLKELGRKRNLQGKETFLCTDNMVSKIIAASGSSKLDTLFDLVVRLHCVIMRFKCNVRLIHVEGTWVINQGTDALSRGDMYEGIMKGGTMLYFLLL